VLNFNGGELVIRCLDSLAMLTWPSDRLEIVVVDNASSDGSRQLVSARYPTVKIIDAGANLGFAGGNNLALRDLEGVDFVALLNNDATVDRHWLARLVAGLQANPTAGAACPKILFEPCFNSLDLAAPVFTPGRGDPRTLGVRLEGVCVDGADRWSDVLFVSGWWGLEAGPVRDRWCQWSDKNAHLHLPVGKRASLLLAAERSKNIEVRCGRRQVTLTVGETPNWHQVPLDGEGFDVINNVGNRLLAGGYGADRGYLEPDRGQYDAPAEVFGWCGASVLLRPSYLDGAGLMDERLFLYYEDLDLSWRGRARGWGHVYIPDSIVRHVHSATAVEGSQLSAYFVERNRLLVLCKNAPAGLAIRAVGRFLLITASYMRRDLVSPLLHGNRPRPRISAARVGAFAGFLRLLPAMLIERRRVRAAQIVPDEEIVGWAEPS
jgi:GT2 family glycosyltransferase